MIERNWALSLFNGDTYQNFWFIIKFYKPRAFEYYPFVLCNLFKKKKNISLGYYLLFLSQENKQSDLIK